MIAKLQKIHQDVIKSFSYQPDIKQHKTVERWSIPEDVKRHGILYGDCEEFAMECRAKCREQGIVSQLAICKDELGQMHCVLHVDGWILDNRQPRVVSVDDLDKIGYTWLAISGNEPGDQWHATLQFEK